MNQVGDVLDHYQSSNVAHVSRHLGWKKEDIVFTKRANLNKASILEIRNVGLVVRADELLGCLYLHGADVLQKRNEPRGFGFVWKVEINAVSKGLDAQAATMSTVFENELLQVQKGSFVTDTLSDLNKRLPRTLSKLGLAFDALLVTNNENDSERLL